VLEEHPLLPTDEQCDLMESFVQAMDLDAFAEDNGDEEE
jgi:ATP-dependent DNA helicase 2 subunit 2